MSMEKNGGSTLGTDTMGSSAFGRSYGDKHELGGSVNGDGLGSGAVLGLLVESGAPIDAMDSEGRTPLMLASAHDKPLAADALLALGAYVYAQDYRRCTALHIACQKAAIKCVKLLSWHDAELAALKLVPDAGGRLAFDVARDSKIRSSMMTLWEASAAGKLDIVSRMLRASVRAKSILWKPWKLVRANERSRLMKRSPLHACCHGAAAAVWKILGQTSQRNGRTGPIHRSKDRDTLPKSSKFVLCGMGYRSIHAANAVHDNPFSVCPARMQPLAPRSGSISLVTPRGISSSQRTGAGASDRKRAASKGKGEEW